MTIASEINKLQENLINAYSSIESKGGTLPANQNFDNLSASINTITGGSSNIITAINNTGELISKNDKVWINEENGSYSIEKLIQFRNFDVIGNPTINDNTGIVSGFSTSNYIQLRDAFNPANNSWDVYVSFNKPSSAPSNNTQIISTSGFQLGITPNPYFWLWVWDKDGNGICNSALNLTYSSMPEHTICHIYFTGSEYKVDYSTDKENWINVFQIASNTPVRNSGTIFIGNCYNSSYRTEYFTGSVDLSETYIKINNSVWWEPYILYASQDYFTGYAQENIASGSSGEVLTLI